MAIHWRSMSVTWKNGIWRTLPRQQFIVLRALDEAEGGVRSNKELLGELYADDPEGGPLGANEHLRQVLFQLSRSIAGSEYYIDNLFRRGWRLLTQDLHDRIALEQKKREHDSC